jgi:2'-5' RNA ligase
MRYSIWLVPSPSDQKYLSKIILYLSKTYGAPAFIPHITLYGGITSLKSAKEAVLMCKQFLPMQLNAAKVRSSSYLWKTVYVEMGNGIKLSNLHKTLRKHLTSQNDYKFNPHLSLIYKKSNKNTRQKIRCDVKLRRSFHFDKIVIIKSSNNVDLWRPLFQMRLGSKRAKKL